MVDLIAAKLSGEDLHALEPRTMLDAWRAAGGTETADLSKEQSIQLAQQLKAGRALLGDVVGTPNRLVLNVSLLDVPKGAQIAKVSVEGPPDSLASLVDQIAQQLLTQTSGEASQRMSNLTSTSLTALRAYLDGQALLRRGDAVNAAKDFERALNEDSTFALAGLGLRLATSWYGDPTLGNRGIDIAWRERARLSARDQALLVALAGPRYPNRSSNLDVYNARLQYLQMVPDNAEARYLLADHIFHFGSAIGIRDWEQQALSGFRKAMTLDSTYLPGYQHAMPLAPSMGDTAFYNRALRLRLASDTATLWRVENDWYMAAHSGDMAKSAAVFTRLGNTPEPILNGIIRLALFDGTGAADAKTAIDRFVSLAVTDQNRRGRMRYAHDVLLALGRPADAARYLSMSKDSAADLNVPIITLRDAAMGVATQQAGNDAARMLRAYEDQPEASDSVKRDIQRAVTRMMEPWRLAHGDTTLTRRSLARLRSLTRGIRPSEQILADIEIAFIEMMHADVTKSPGLRRSVERLDSLMLLEDVTHGSTGRWAQQTIGAARVWEELGEPDRALRMVSRYSVWETESLPYIGVQLREQGRLASLAGDRDRAIRAYRHFIRMSADAEPSMQRELDSARRELAKLESVGR
jgi:tetratricopeptide (TPR) repeat protein